MFPENHPAVLQLIEAAIYEDLSLGDITSDMLIPTGHESFGRLIAKENFVVAGQLIAGKVFHRIDPAIQYRVLVPDGQSACIGQPIAEVNGSTAAILAGERIALNFLQRLSGIATGTRNAVQSLAGTDCRVIDTRKTTPGWRILEKYAVRMGGGWNHRMSLGDGILIKDNHIKAVGSVGKAVALALEKRRHPLKIQVEVTTAAEAAEAVAGGADALLLDNMTPEEIVELAARYRDKVLLETSGNITHETLGKYAAAGVHLISMGKLTHSVTACDISLKLE